ncbi:MAG: hypothetical protein J5654_13010 [Victivallales bacterium]|nr:hypothetical protein [Victivallales bacterium]
MLHRLFDNLGNLHVSKASLTASKYKIRGELRKMGFLSAGSPLDKVQCILEFRWSGLAGYMGWYFSSDQNIHIPTFCIAAMLPNGEKRILADVLRHEYGHALEGKYWKFFHCKEFRDVFGKPYGTSKSLDTNANHYVSTYAMTCSQEDFAETFMYYIKYKGKVPLKWSDNRAIRIKWLFINDLCVKITLQNGGS